MANRVILHAGFHKTGTTTLQRALRVNRPLLRPYLRSVLKHPLSAACNASRAYSRWRYPLLLRRFERRFRAAMAEIGDAPGRCMLISAEELSGHLPGRKGIPDYRAAIALARVMDRVLTEVMPEAELVFAYTTRDAGPWLRSAYWQHVRASSLTLDEAEYVKRFALSADLSGMVQRIADQVSARVVNCPLEAAAGLPAGPATPLLDLCDVPRDVQSRMVMQDMNPHLGQEVLEKLLQANREIRDKQARATAKRAILAEAEGQADDD